MFEARTLKQSEQMIGSRDRWGKVGGDGTAPVSPGWPRRSVAGTFLALVVFGVAFGEGDGSCLAVEAKALSAGLGAGKVRVTTKREGAVTHFYVENDELCEVTMTFEVGSVNMRGSTEFPYTAVFPPHQTTEAFVLTPREPGTNWNYSWTDYYKLGSNSAKHDDTCVYRLPYAPTSSFRVTQGYGGSFSHKGANLYAIDWEMPEGTSVYAARGGKVVRTRDDSNAGGSSSRYDGRENYVLIRHDDGTLGHYCHLRRGGCCVAVGQTVAAGELIARSGNTGFSSGPHLHFAVLKPKSGRERESVPVRFGTATAGSPAVQHGSGYEAGSPAGAAQGQE